MASILEVCDTLLVGDTTAHAAEFSQRALVIGKGGGIRAWPLKDGPTIGFDNFLDVVHAGCEARAHVDQNVGRRTDHDVEVWLGLDGAACQDAYTLSVNVYVSRYVCTVTTYHS